MKFEKIISELEYVYEFIKSNTNLEPIERKEIREKLATIIRALKNHRVFE